MNVRIRDRADRLLLELIVAFAATVVGIRWFLQLTGYPQVGGGEIHIAHLLWGGLILFAAAALPLIFVAPRISDLSAVAAGIGTGLFIDEIGKVITATNDYFYPLAAPLIYGSLLVLVLAYLIIRDRSRGSRPSAVDVGDPSDHGGFRRALIAGLTFFGLGWTLSLMAFIVVDETTLRQTIEAAVHIPGDRVERPDDPAFYVLEAVVLGASGILQLAGAIALMRRRDRLGTELAIAGLAIALTAGGLLTVYVEQVSAILSLVLSTGLLLAVLRYRDRTVLIPVTNTSSRRDAVVTPG